MLSWRRQHVCRPCPVADQVGGTRSRLGQEGVACWDACPLCRVAGALPPLGCLPVSQLAGRTSCLSHDPHPSSYSLLTAADKLQREADSLIQRATALLHRMRFMASRISEARQLGRAPRAGETGQQAQHPMPPPEQQQEQQQQEEPAAASNCGAGTSAGAASAAAGDNGMGPSGSTNAGAAVAGTAGGAVGPSAHQEQAGMECPVCFALVPAGSDIHVFG